MAGHFLIFQKAWSLWEMNVHKNDHNNNNKSLHLNISFKESCPNRVSKLPVFNRDLCTFYIITLSFHRSASLPLKHST